MEKEGRLSPGYLQSEFFHFTQEYDPEGSYVPEDGKFGGRDLLSYDISSLNIALLSEGSRFFVEGEPYYFPFLHVEKDAGRYSLKIYCHRSDQPLLDISSNLAACMHMLQFINGSTDTRRRYANVYALLKALYDYYRRLFPKYRDGKMFIPYDTDAVRQLLEIDGEGRGVFSFQNSIGFIHECVDDVYAEFEKRYERIAAQASKSGRTFGIKKEQFKDWLQHGSPANDTEGNHQRIFRSAARNRINEVALWLRERLLEKAEQDKAVRPSFFEQLQSPENDGDRSAVVLQSVRGIHSLADAVLAAVSASAGNESDNNHYVATRTRGVGSFNTPVPDSKHVTSHGDRLTMEGLGPYASSFFEQPEADEGDRVTLTGVGGTEHAHRRILNIVDLDEEIVPDADPDVVPSSDTEELQVEGSQIPPIRVTTLTMSPETAAEKPEAYLIEKGDPENVQKILAVLEETALISTCKPSRDHAILIADILFGKITDVYLREDIVNEIALDAYSLDMAFMSSTGMHMFFRQARKVRDAIVESGLGDDADLHVAVVDLLLNTK